LRSILACVFTLISTTAAFAGPVAGRVTDPDGRAVPGARVIVVPSSGPALTTITDAAGAFTIATPDRGRIDVRVAFDGFRAASVTIDATPERRDLGELRLAISAITESLVVSAAQVEIPLSQASTTVTVLTGAELQARQVHTVADALRGVPGLSVVGTGGYGALTSVFPRGGESDYTLVYVDGVQANSFGGEFDFAHLSTTNIERIEIVRGPQSALFGSNAIGAVVRVITRRGGPLAGSATLEGGSFGSGRAAVAASGQRGAFEFGGGADWLESDGHNGARTAAGQTIENDRYTRRGLTASAGWRDGAANLRGDVRYATDERGFPGPFGTNPLGAYGGVDTVSKGTTDRWLTALAAAWPLGARVRAHAQTSYGRTQYDFLSPFGPSESSTRRWSGRAQADAALHDALDTSAGVEIQREQAGSSYITGAAFDPVPVKRTIAGYFAEARWRAPRQVFVTAGVRVDDIRRDALEEDPNPFGPRPAFAAESIVSVNPKVSAAWFVRGGAADYTKLRAAAGTGIRPPSGFEIAFTDNPRLKPERSRSFEAAVEQALAGGNLQLEGTLFLNDFDDLIIAVGSFSESSRYRTANIANARARGVELATTARGRIGGRRAIGVQARVAYTFLDSEVLAVDEGGAAQPPFTVGDSLLQRPRHQLSLDASATAGPLTAFVRGGARGRVLAVEPTLGTFHPELFDAPGYSVWNAGAAWRLRNGLELFGRIDNVFDRAYEETFGFPALGRGAFAGIRVAAGR
jgi:outer membrane cobalamin receptor